MRRGWGGHNAWHSHLEAVFDSKPLFPTTSGIDTTAHAFRQRYAAASEADIELFQRVAIDPWVLEAATTYLQTMQTAIADGNDDIPDRPQMPGSTAQDLPQSMFFHDYPFGREPDVPSDEDDWPAFVQAMSVAQIKHLQNKAAEAEAKAKAKTTAATTATEAHNEHPPVKRVRTAGPRYIPDMWLLRHDKDKAATPVLVAEYKAAHKLRASMIKTALRATRDEDLFTAAIRATLSNKTDTDPESKAVATCISAVARVFTQAFHYMVEFGLCFSYVSSGEALVLLHLDANDTSTLYYHLSVPRDDVERRQRNGDSATATGPEQPMSPDSLRKTGVAVVLTMALLAMDGEAQTQRWKKQQIAALKEWPEPYDDLLRDSQSSEATKTDPGHKKTTTEPLQIASNPAQDKTSTEAPKRAWQYCTQACLLGLKSKGALDANCPNFAQHMRFAVSDEGMDEKRNHGESGTRHDENKENNTGSQDVRRGTTWRHGLTTAQLLQHTQAQLAQDLDDDCEALDKYGKFGAISMLFRIGCAATATASQQGRLVPVCLGPIALVDDYIAYTCARVNFMLLLSYAGESLATFLATSSVSLRGPRGAAPPPVGPPPGFDVEVEAHRLWHELHMLGVDDREMMHAGGRRTGTHKACLCDEDDAVMIV
ncbi:hypothetical protein SCUCBS95973_004843 [Sporothrix curviconia]|uniref:Fungal-type protein kinase domain-containing protein n=1 Tax=Sporothrix curviconia TaxID=1260050 RepID=A0ABP0BRZ3_9PEZI